jgi:hypothetical protein
VAGGGIMKIEKEWWWLIGICLFLRGVATLCTIYGIEILHKDECNPFMSGTFGVYGLLLPSILSAILVVVVILFERWVLLKVNNQALIAIWVLLLIGILLFDTVNDIWVLQNFWGADITNHVYAVTMNTMRIKLSCGIS